jgi:hypothetical protein
MIWRTILMPLLVAAPWLAAPAIGQPQLAQARLNHHDILGRWCSATGAYVIDRRRLHMIRYADGRKTQMPVLHFTFGLNRVTLHGTAADGRPTQVHVLNMRPLGPTFRLLRGGLYRRC